MALGIYFLIFELRYMWHLNANDFLLLRISNVVLMLTTFGLWVFFPSPLLVALVAFFGLVFPPFYDRNAFAMIDFRFTGFLLLGVCLLVAVTFLWRGARA